MAESTPSATGVSQFVKRTGLSRVVKAQWVGIAAGVALGIAWTVEDRRASLQSAVDSAIIGDGSALKWSIGCVCRVIDRFVDSR